jgi:hypothetical protein
MTANQTPEETAAAELVATELVATELAAKLFPKSFARHAMEAHHASDLRNAPTRSARYAADRRNAR